MVGAGRPGALLLGSLLAFSTMLSAQEITVSPHGALTLECSTCHNAEGWSPVHVSRRFDHSAFGFPLKGAHGTANCRACHQDLTFTDTPTRCVACHQDVHRGELGPDCTKCHSQNSFLDRSEALRLHQTTRFPLQGAHLSADCSSCHPSTAQGNLRFVAQATDCISCHQPVFAATRNPDHQAAGFSTDCGGCHSATLWTRVNYNHDLLGFPLTGAHRTLNCDRCHAGFRFTGAPVACVGCHQQDYDHTSTPNHAQAAFPTDCASCHRTTSWSAPYDHNRTRFPLTGAHRAVACQQCHANGTYAGTPTTCVPCHQNDYSTAAQPDHRASGFSLDCQVCHTTSQWLGAKFDHSATPFPLTGAHRSLTCQQCHGDGVYAGKATTCVSCHQTQYDQTTNPGHRAAGFPTDCASCHTTTTWSGATFDHDSRFFPVYSGHHRGTWNSCADCHTTASNYQIFTCTTCHTRSRTDGDHGEVSGYQYVSSECLRCHPRG